MASWGHMCVLCPLSPQLRPGSQLLCRPGRPRVLELWLRSQERSLAGGLPSSCPAFGETPSGEMQPLAGSVSAGARGGQGLRAVQRGQAEVSGLTE